MSHASYCKWPIAPVSKKWIWCYCHESLLALKNIVNANYWVIIYITENWKKYDLKSSLCTAAPLLKKNWGEGRLYTGYLKSSVVLFKNLANPSHTYYTSAMLNSRTKEGFFKKIVKFFSSRLRNFCFAAYFYLFVKYSGLFWPATLTRTRDLYPRVATRDIRHTHDSVFCDNCQMLEDFDFMQWRRTR